MAYLIAKRRSALRVLRMKRSMPGGIFLPSSVESCGCDHGISSTEEDVCPSSPKKKRSMIMAVLLPSPVKSCGGDHSLLEKRRFALPTPKRTRTTMATSLLPQ